MAPDIKFCGLTRAGDAALAAELGARFVGAIFAGGPRNLTFEAAKDVLDAAGQNMGRVGVFATADVGVIQRAVEVARLTVVQLHGDPTLDEIDTVREKTGGAVWPVVRVAGSALPPHTEAMLERAGAVLLDAKVDGALGGTGVSLPWAGVERALAPMRNGARVVLAGGLTPSNVAQAIRELHPDVVDVSSGVESAPGIKDHQKMRAFARAVGQ